MRFSSQTRFNKELYEISAVLNYAIVQQLAFFAFVCITQLFLALRYLLKTTSSSHTHTFHPLSTIVIHTFNFPQVKSMDDNCGEWVECMGVSSGCGEQEVGVASGSGRNLWVWLLV